MQKPIDNQAVYQKWILVVLWIFQLISEVIVIGVNGFYVALLSAIEADDIYHDNLTGVFVASAVSLAFGISFFVAHIVQITLFGRHRLTPRANFAYDCTRFIIWTIVFILNIVGIVLVGGYLLSVIFAVLVWMLYLLGVIYASILFHRQRRGQYDHLLPVSAGQGRLYNQQAQQGKQEVIYPNNDQNVAYQLSSQQPHQEQSHPPQQDFRQSQEQIYQQPHHQA